MSSLILIIFVLNVFLFNHPAIAQQTGTFQSCRHVFKHIDQNLWTYDTLYFNVPNATGITDVNITIDSLFHTWISDLTVEIRHLTLRDTLVNHRGGSGDNFLHTELNDSAILHISQGSPPFTGSFRPEVPLVKFNGNNNPNGAWVLAIGDFQGGDDGYLRAWCVQIQYQTVIGIGKEQNIPEHYSLYQNYPNPFNPKTIIRFQIKDLTFTRMIVFDVLGLEVATLVSEHLMPGSYEVEWNASGVTSGIYFYSLIGDNAMIDTKKMVLIK